MEERRACFGGRQRINDKGLPAARESAVLLHLIDLRDLAMAGHPESSVFSPQSCSRGQAELKARFAAGMAAALAAIAARRS